MLTPIVTETPITRNGCAVESAPTVAPRPDTLLTLPTQPCHLDYNGGW